MNKRDWLNIKSWMSIVTWTSGRRHRERKAGDLVIVVVLRDDLESRHECIYDCLWLLRVKKDIEYCSGLNNKYIIICIDSFKRNFDTQRMSRRVVRHNLSLLMNEREIFDR
jgi:hypothetical protein